MTFDDYVERFRLRVMQDAIAEALPAYWERRAQMFEWAKSKPSDRLGADRTEEQRAARDEELQTLADECRRRAQSREDLGPDWWEPLLREVLRDAEQEP